MSRRSRAGTFHAASLAGGPTAQALAQRVEVDAKEVRIMGAKSVLSRTLVAASSPKTAGFGVASFLVKWRTRHDTNGVTFPSGGRRPPPPSPNNAIIRSQEWGGASPLLPRRSLPA